MQDGTNTQTQQKDETDETGVEFETFATLNKYSMVGGHDFPIYVLVEGWSGLLNLMF